MKDTPIGDPSFEEFLEHMLPREEEQDMLVNWLAWCLQNESQKHAGLNLRKLFGEQNSSTENNVSKLVSRFNASVLENKFVICEELQIPRLD
jgi:hypothetical protein